MVQVGMAMETAPYRRLGPTAIQSVSLIDHLALEISHSAINPVVASIRTRAGSINKIPIMEDSTAFLRLLRHRQDHRRGLEAVAGTPLESVPSPGLRYELITDSPVWSLSARPLLNVIRQRDLLLPGRGEGSMITTVT